VLVDVGLGDGETDGLGVLVVVGVAVGVRVLVAVAVAVGLGVLVIVGVAVGLGVLVVVGVAVGMAVGVAVGPGVLVGTGVPVPEGTPSMSKAKSRELPLWLVQYGMPKKLLPKTPGDKAPSGLVLKVDVAQ
jgi:hypothetical protein